MRRQMQDDVHRMAQPAEGYTEFFLENTARTEAFLSQDNSGISAFPGSGSIETSVFNALSIQSKNTVSVWDISEGLIFTLRYANPAFLHLIGKAPNEVLGKSLDSVIPHETRRLMHSRFTECVRRQCEVEFIHEQFGYLHITRLYPQMEAGRTVRLIGTNTDVTEYMLEQNRLKSSIEQLRQQTLLLSARVKFETLIRRALCEFMDAGSTGFDGCLAGLNRDLGMLLNADQAFILQRYSDCLCIHKARWMRNSGWLCPGIGHISSVSDNSSLSQLNRLLVINDTQYDRVSPYSQDLHRYGIRALIAVPIYRDTQYFGLLCLAQTENPRIWTTAEISMVRTAADTIMSAYMRTCLENGLQENIRILTEYDEALQDLLGQKETLAEVSGNFLHAGTQGFNEYVLSALRDIGRLLGLDGIRAVLRTEEEPEIIVWQDNGLPRRFGREYRRLNEMALRIASLRIPVSFDDTSAENTPQELARAAAEEGMRSCFIVPLCGGERYVGALIGYKVIGIKAWTPGDISTSEAFARVFADAYCLRNS